MNFYNEFGAVLKEGLHADFFNKDKITELLLFQTTKTENDKPKSLAQYVADMPEGQKEIYYILAENKTKALSSPKLEYFKSQGYEVLLFIDPIDEWVSPHLNEFDKKPMKSVEDQELKLNEGEDKKKEVEEKQTQYSFLLKEIQEQLKEEVKEVRFSSRLIDSVCCLSSDGAGMTSQMEKMFKAMGQPVPPMQKVLELNPSHPLISVLDSLAKDKATTTLFRDYVSLLHEQARLTEGSQLKDPLQFAKKVSDLMVQAHHHTVS